MLSIGVYVSRPSSMQFLWEQLIVVSCEGVILCIVRHLLFFFHSLVCPLDFSMSVHDCTMLFFLHISALYGTTDVHCRQTFKLLPRLPVLLLFCSGVFSTYKQCWSEHSCMHLPIGGCGGVLRAHVEKENHWGPVFVLRFDR